MHPILGWLTASVDISSPTRCYLHWPHDDNFFFYIIPRPEVVNHKGKGRKLRKLTESFEYIFTSSWFIFEAGGNLSVCSAALTGLTSRVLRIWAICVSLPVPLYGVVAVPCHRHLRGSVVLSREVRSIIWFSEYLVVLRGVISWFAWKSVIR